MFARLGNKIYRRSDVKASKGDVITMELDADARTLKFRKDGSEANVTVNIESGEYCLAVSMRSSGDSVTLVE